ncbi:MAG: hypothetical protein ACKO4U_16060 [Caldilinea sp.]
MLRGGSWGSNDNGVRSALRYNPDPIIWYNHNGFRCVRSQ